MKGVSAALVVVGFVGSFAACSESTTSLLPEPSSNNNVPAGMIVSNVRPSGNGNVVGGSSAPTFTVGSAGLTVSYVSASPGTFNDAVSATLRNGGTGPIEQIVIVDGGFDPVAVPAVPGDQLSLVVTSSVGQTTYIVLKVPLRHPPEVVRTSPAKGRVDVALTIQIEVVFSEPVDKTTVTTTSLALFDMQSPVPGTVALAQNGLSAVFIPNAPLKEQTTYKFVIGQDLRDLDGDAPAEASTVNFTTARSSAVPDPAGQLRPDGELLFVRSDRQIYRINLDGTGLSQMTFAGLNDRPAWSPDGRRIAFERNTPGPENRGSGQTDIYLMAADGSNIVRRTLGFEFWSAAWSPDGRKLAVSDEGIYYATTWIISADDDGNPPIQIAKDARTPAWSPDGSRIAFIRTSGDDGYHQAFIMNSDGTHVVPLTEFDSGGLFGLAWSPDGTKLSFAKCLNGCDLWIINADGSEQHRLTDVGNVDGTAWSPDGQWLAVGSSIYVSPTRWISTISYVPATGGQLTTLIEDGYAPSWKQRSK